MGEIVTRVDGLTLPVYDEDSWPSIPPGHWESVDCVGWSEAVAAAGGLGALTVWSTITDPYGFYGSPCIATVWGHKHDSDGPVVAAGGPPYDFGTPCTDEHAVFVPDTKAPELEDK